MTVAYLQAMIGKANAYFRNMGFISPKMAREVSKYIPDLNIDYINTGIGEMFVIPEEVKREQQKKSGLIPLLPITAVGGTLTGFSEGVIPNDCETIQSPISGADYAIKIEGDSMEPDYPSGCVVFIKKVNEKLFLDWGNVYVLDTYNGVIIKKLMPGKEDRQVQCVSVNPAYPAFPVNIADVYGFYRVMAKLISVEKRERSEKS